MIDALSPRAAPLLDRLAARDVLLAFDFDGTLAPIVREPHRARLGASTRTLLRALAARRRVAIVSGRARADVASRVRGVGAFAIVGNHGLELDAGPSWTWPVEVVGAVRGAVRALEGVVVEDKGATLTVHYRRAPDPGRAGVRVRAALARVLADVAPNARLVGGHAVENVLPAGAHDKGTAVAALMCRVGARRALFVGDDRTDDAVFALPRAAGVVGVSIGRRRGCRAALVLDTQREIDRLLGALLARVHAA